jgi:autotransporter-associated beta strand protein
MSTATADLILNSPLAMNAANTWNVAASQTLTLGSQISGAFGITKVGDGTAVLSSSANSYTGNTTVTAGTLLLGNNNVIPHGAGGVAGNVVVNGTLDLNGKSDSINGLSGSGVVDNTGAATSTLGVGNNSQTSTFSGVIQSTTGNVNLIKTGNGTLTLSGANTFTGTVTINASTGTLALANTAPLNNVTGITIGGGTTLTSQTTGITITPPVTLGGPSATISFGRSTADPGTFTLNGGISGMGSLVLSTPNVNSGGNLQTIVLDGAGTYDGATTITTGNIGNAVTVKAGVENTLPTATVLEIDGGNGSGSGRTLTFDLAGNNQTLAGLNNNISTLTARNQRVTSGAAATLTIDNSVDCTYGGAGIPSTFNGNPVNPNAQITGAITLAKSGSGTFTLLGPNNYTGATILTGGTLAIGGNNGIPDASPVSIGGAILAVGAGFTDTVGTLDVTAAASINLGADAKLIFADSSGINSGTWAGTLTITGDFVSGVSLKFGGDINGLTPAQIAAISGPGLSNIGINTQGFLTATVAASAYTTWAADNAGGQGAELDFDNDGVRNGVEFFLDAAPGFTANPALNGSNVITWTNGGNIPASAYGSQFVVQTSGDLSNWTNVDIDDLTTNTGDIGVPGSLTYALTGTGPRFVRLKVLPD